MVLGATRRFLAAFRIALVRGDRMFGVSHKNLSPKTAGDHEGAGAFVDRVAFGGTGSRAHVTPFVSHMMHERARRLPSLPTSQFRGHGVSRTRGSVAVSHDANEYVAGHGLWRRVRGRDD
jgi:hypothetical protein